MAVTLEDYTNVAPTVMATGDFTLEAVETKLASVPASPEPPTPPEVTKAKVIAIFNALFDDGIEASGGLLGLAQTVKLTVDQVKTIVEELNAMHNIYLYGVPVEPEPPIEE